MLRRVPDKHGNLHRNHAALDEVEGILTAQPVVVRQGIPPVSLRVTVPELAFRGERITVNVAPADRARQSILLKATDEAGRLAEARLLRPSAGTITVTLDDLPPGAYTIDVSGTDGSSPYEPVSSDILIW